MEKKMINRTGGCICGEIKFTVKLDEIPLVFNCHCIDCRKKLGGIMTIILLRDGAIDVDKSKLKIYEHSGGSGHKIKKHFCEKCAAPILTFVENLYSPSILMKGDTCINFFVLWLSKSNLSFTLNE